MSIRGKKFAHRGFTLIELLTVLVIMSLITLTLLVQQNKFDSSTVLRSLAYSIALSARQAQVYGVSVLGVSAGGAPTYAPAYGLYFNSLTPKSYLIFADTNGNGQYDVGTDAVEQTFALNNGYTISNFCAKGVNGASPVTRCVSTNFISSLEILFKRPNPDAQFVALQSSGAPIAGDSYSEVYITILGTGGDTRSVSMSTTGQVAVWAPNTPPL